MKLKNTFLSILFTLASVAMYAQGLVQLTTKAGENMSYNISDIKFVKPLTSGSLLVFSNRSKTQEVTQSMSAIADSTCSAFMLLTEYGTASLFSKAHIAQISRNGTGSKLTLKDGYGDVYVTESYATVVAQAAIPVGCGSSSTATGADYVTTDSFSTFVPTSIFSNIPIGATVWSTTRGALFQKTSTTVMTRRSWEDGQKASTITSSEGSTLTFNSNLNNRALLIIPSHVTTATISAPTNISSQSVGEVFQISIQNSNDSTVTINWNAVFGGFLTPGTSVTTTVSAGSYSNYLWQCITDGAEGVVLTSLNDLEGSGTGITTGDKGEIDVVNASNDWRIDTGAVSWIKLEQAVKDSINAGGGSGDDVSAFSSAYAATANERYIMSGDSSLTHQKLINQTRDSVGISQFDWLQYAEQRSNNIGDSIMYQLKNTDTLHVLYRISDTKAAKYEMQKRDDYRKLVQVSIVEPEKYTNWTSSTGTWSGTSLKSGGLGNTITLTFTGTGTLLNYYSDNSRGKIKFVLDGNAADTIVVDGYNSGTVSYARATLWEGLEYGSHTIVGTVITKNPSSSGNNFSIWNYVGGSVVLRDNYNFVVKTFDAPTYTYELEKITATGSNVEYALNVSPLGSGLSAAFVPYHGVDANRMTGDSLKIYVDGKWGVSVPGVASPYRSAKKLVVTQENYAWHPDSIGVPGKQVLQLNTTHSFEKSRCDVTGNFKWLRRTIVSGYSFMFPISTSWGDTLTTSQGQKIGLDLIDNSNQTVTNKQGLANSFIATKNGGKYAIAARINDDATLRKNRPYRATVPQFVEHRNDGLTQKLYNNIYNSDTTDVGELLNTSFSLFVINKDTSSWTPLVAVGSGGGSTTVAAGTGISVVESPTDTWTVTNTGDTDGTDDVTSAGLTTNTVPKASASKVLSNSQILDDGITVTVGGTSGIIVPIGTTAQQSAGTGKVRYNSSNSAFEYYNGTTSTWEVPVKSSTTTGLFTAKYIPFADANGRLSQISGFRYEGSTSGLIVDGIQFNGGAASASITGQGFGVAGSSRMMSYFASGANATAGDQAAFYTRVGSITRTASTVWQGWEWDMQGLQSGSTVRDFTMHNHKRTIGVNMDTMTWMRLPTPVGGFAITKNKGIIQQDATLNGIGTLYPSRNLDVRGTARFADFYNQNDSTGTTGQIPVKRASGWGWRGLVASDIPQTFIDLMQDSVEYKDSLYYTTVFQDTAWMSSLSNWQKKLVRAGLSAQKQVKDLRYDIPYPTEITAAWQPKASVYVAEQGFKVDVDLQALRVKRGTTYYVSVNGDDTDDGRNRNTPFRNIKTAYNQADCGRIEIENGVYDFQSGTSAITSWNKDVEFIGLGDSVIIAHHPDSLTYTQPNVGVFPNLWASTLPAAYTVTSVAGVIDLHPNAPRDSLGNPIPVRQVTGTTDVDTIAHSWRADGVNGVYLHLTGNRTPDAYVLVFGNVGYPINITSGSRKLYFENIKLWGGQSTFRYNSGATVTTPRITFNNCNVSYGCGATGYNVEWDNAGELYFLNSTSAYGKEDCLSYISSSTGKPRIFEANSLAYSAGYYATSLGANNNASTIHDDVLIIRVNGRYYGAGSTATFRGVGGRIIHDTGSAGATSVNINCVAKSSTGTGSDERIDFTVGNVDATSTSTKAYYYYCSTSGSNSLSNFRVGNGNTAIGKWFYRHWNLSGSPSSGTVTVDSGGTFTYQRKWTN